MQVSHYQRQMEELNYKINRHMAAFLHPILHHYHITELQYQTISYIKKHEACAIGEVAKALHQDAGNMSCLCKKLEKMKFIQRKRSVEDERIVNLYICEQGTLCLNDIDSFTQAHYDKQWKCYSDKDKEIILNGLQKLNQFYEIFFVKDGNAND